MSTSIRENSRRRTLSSKFSLRSLKRRLKRFFQLLALFFYVILLILFAIIILLCFEFMQNQPRPNLETNETKHFQAISIQTLIAQLDYSDPSHYQKDFEQLNSQDIKGESIDWHDHAAMATDKERSGPGEQGKPVLATDITIKDTENSFNGVYGINTFISDSISVNRSLPDIRMPGCLKKQYLAELPTVSIVIVCRDEHNSVLKRTLHSIFNRTPKSLLKEIIIVDDNSFQGCKKNELSAYTEEHFPKLTQFISQKPQGRIFSRMAGAKIAIGDVIIFFDSHMECNYNWLPPLLAPIAVNSHIVTCPTQDIIAYDNFEYQTNDFVHRGGFNWDLTYLAMHGTSYVEADPTKTFQNPIMFDGPFAISRQYFWDLGGFDIGPDFRGAEQFELSFKIWMCGGTLLTVPCSRVGRIFKDLMLTQAEFNKERKDLMMHNKRIAEVWMDEYKTYLYDLNIEGYKNLDAGNLTAQLDIRKRLECKSFKWFLETVAFDILELNPINLELDFANGVLQSIGYPSLCLDNMNQHGIHVGVYECSSNYEEPHSNQFWRLSKHQELKNHWGNLCLDVHELTENARVYMLACHHQRGNQFWYYEAEREWLIHGPLHKCLEVIEEGGQFKVVVNECDEAKEQMKWLFGFVNYKLKPKMYYDQFLKKGM